MDDDLRQRFFLSLFLLDWREEKKISFLFFGGKNGKCGRKNGKKNRFFFRIEKRFLGVHRKMFNLTREKKVEIGK